LEWLERTIEKDIHLYASEYDYCHLLCFFEAKRSEKLFASSIAAKKINTGLCRSKEARAWDSICWVEDGV